MKNSYRTKIEPIDFKLVGKDIEISDELQTNLEGQRARLEHNPQFLSQLSCEEINDYDERGRKYEINGPEELDIKASKELPQKQHQLDLNQQRCSTRIILESQMVWIKLKQQQLYNIPRILFNSN